MENDSINKKYNCEQCNKIYKSRVGLWKHNQTYHIIVDLDKNNQEIGINVDTDIKEYNCIHCNKKYTNKFSKYKHQIKCKINNNNQLEKIKLEFNDEINKLKSELEIIKNKPANVTNIKNINNINKGIINNNKGPVYNFLSKPGEENLSILTEKEIESILEQEMNCLVYMVELLNFNEKLPENHSFCTTALNDKYISTLNTETLMVEKKRKKDFFDLMLNNSLKNIKVLYDKLKYKKTPKALKFKQTIDNLTEYVVINHKGKKAYVEMMNTLSFNKRHITQSTWFQLMNNQIPHKESIVEDDIENKDVINTKLLLENKTNQLLCKNRNQLIILPDSDDSSDSESSDELIEIKVQGVFYYMEAGNKLYLIETNGKKGTFIGRLVNGKIKKEIVC
jgi:hypothetical protein